jgi:hypothetical protein
VVLLALGVAPADLARGAGLQFALGDVDGWLGLLGPLTLWLLPLVFQAVVAFGVFDALRGGRVPWSASLVHGLARSPHAVGTSVLTVLVFAAPLLLLSLAFPHANAASSLLGGLLGAFAAGSVATLAGHLFVGVQAAVVEEVGPARALLRSARLAEGLHQSVFRLVVVVYVLPYLFSLLVVGVIASKPESTAREPEPVRASRSTSQATRWREAALVRGGLDSVFGAFQAVTCAVAYCALRKRKEGVGLDELLAVFD